MSNLLGNSGEFCTVIRAARLVAMTDVTVLIEGESGTGKELLAQTIHQHSPRAQGAFITINCAALPENLAESELFGHRKGAFTGAVADQQGRIQAANGGTLFLDEIGELPLSIQAKLLRFLEMGECQVIGQSRVELVDTRIIAATNRDLYAQTQQGKFRQDLYYRLNIVPLELPPLRKRLNDLEMLLQAFTKELAERHKLSPPHYNKATLKRLHRYKWPGNIRELRNFSERMLIFFSGKTIEPTHLPRQFQSEKTAMSAEGFSLPETGINLEALEIQMIRQALDKTYGNRSQAARLLGLTRDTLLYRIKKHAIEI
ncbi:two component, sigma54 specific, transcriptional regulator, Fis family [Candidatus Thiomargarita nelsonii]|uniref:Two component, sigma54 specific, transcriptional regulator, Fis family n=1 Tax=Candidatus Thiomargarita nelsonii TaxID=1003181 RepID=A0A176S5E1_9GAMM|nr:two component, sigma54 specific, transcriptional regulator, Fis family [Candidatus Thiomargarita nelsonii]